MDPNFIDDSALLDLSYVLRELGGDGSGNFGHAGRPGEVGGSSGWPGSTDLTIFELPHDVEKRYDSWVASLTREEIGAIDLYTSESEYGSKGNGVMNAVLRGYYDARAKVDPEFARVKSEAEQQSNVLLAALGKATAPPPEFVWRGVSSDVEKIISDLTPGTEVRLLGFQSATLDPRTASKFGGTLLEIRPVRGAYISGENLAGKFSVGEHSPGETEFLMPHNEVYKVLGVKNAIFSGVSKRVIQLEMLR